MPGFQTRSPRFFCRKFFVKKLLHPQNNARIVRGLRTLFRIVTNRRIQMNRPATHANLLALRPTRGADLRACDARFESKRYPH